MVIIQDSHGAMAGFERHRCSTRVLLYQLSTIFGLLIATQGDAKTVRVGGDAGWTNVDPATARAPDYAVWAASQTLYVNDVLGKICEMYRNVLLLIYA